MTPIEKVKVEYADARINFEMVQDRLNKASQALIQELNKPPVPETVKSAEPVATVAEGTV